MELAGANCAEEITFFDKNWEMLGTKLTLLDKSSVLSGIPLDVLEDAAMLHQYNSAQQSSWAAARLITREEDRAYFLLELLDTNMTLIYSEGEVRAFERI